MTTRRTGRDAAEGVLVRVIRRYDPSAFDAPPGESRVRLVIRDGAHRTDVPDHGAEANAHDVVITARGAKLEPAARSRPDAVIAADAATWRHIADDVRAGMTAYRAGRLSIRHNLNLAMGLLAATAAREPGRLEVLGVQTPHGLASTLQAGVGEPVLMIHGLGATKASFLPTISALQRDFRTIAFDLPGFGDAVKPVRGAYDAPFFARAAIELLDALDIPRAHVVGHSLGGRVALEVGMTNPSRVQSLTLMTPSMAWRRSRPWAPYLRLVRPELAMFQPAPRTLLDPMIRRMVPGAHQGWGAVAVDEFLRGFLDPRGRVAFYKAARNIYLENPSGTDGFWDRLAALQEPALFIWGRRDRLVPAAFARHVEEALPDARHVVLPCGHVPQLERPAQLHEAISRFLHAHPMARRRAGRSGSGGSGQAAAAASH